MFPIRDHNPSNRTPYVTYGLMALNIGVFVSYWGMMGDARALATFYSSWALIPADVAGGQRSFTLLTSMFLHGGVLHVAGNMLFLWIFGDNLEDELGHTGFALFYLAAGLGAGLVQVLSSPASAVPVVGASGAIAGVMGGYLLLFPRAKVDVLFIFIVFFKVFAIPAWVMLGLWFGLQLLNGFASDVSAGGVAYWAHAGGFVIGLALMLAPWRKRGGARFWSRTHGQPPHPEARYDLSRTSIPRIRRRK